MGVIQEFFDGLLVLWGIILLINAIYSLIHAPNQFLSFDTLKSLLLPLVLLVFNLPVVYGLALYNTYEQIFIRIKGSKSEQKKMKWQVIRFSGINLSKVSAIRKSLPNTIVCCRTSNDLQINLKKLARRLDLQIGENYDEKVRTAPQNEKINVFTHKIKTDIEKYSKHIEQFCEDFKHYY